MSVQPPQITVIIPLFNNKKQVPACIESILSQTLQNIEVLCIDMGSTDGTVELLKSISEEDPRLKVFLSYKKTYGGLLNHGLSIAKGRYVTFIKIGSILKDNLLESLNNQSQKNYIDMIQCATKSTSLTENDDNIVLPIEKAFTIRREPLFINNFRSLEGILFKKSFLVLKTVNFHEEDDDFIDEFFFYETALKAATIKYTDNIVYEINDCSSDDSFKSLFHFSSAMNTLLDVNKKYNNSDKNVNDNLYRLLFKHIESVYCNFNVDVEDYESCEMLNNLLRNVDKEFVRRKLNSDEKQFFYRFCSPLILKQFTN